jgi:hypothetical protein
MRRSLAAAMFLLMPLLAPVTIAVADDASCIATPAR